MEKEICRRETTKKIATIFKYIAYACAIMAGLCLTTVILVAAVGDDWEYLFMGDTSYTYPIIIGVVFAVLAVLFFLIERKSGSVTMSLVLTDKRIYGRIETAKINKVESYTLNAVTYHSLSKSVVGKERFTLVFKTPTNTAKFTVDEEFYNEFVNAVNATINEIE